MLSRAEISVPHSGQRDRGDNDGLALGHPRDHDVEERAHQQADDPEQDSEVGLHEDDLSPTGPDEQRATRRQRVYSSQRVVFTTL